jgi:hypothetical protein
MAVLLLIIEHLPKNPFVGFPLPKDPATLRTQKYKLSGNFPNGDARISRRKEKP